MIYHNITLTDDDHERKIRVEIKPLNNGAAPMSASVDELRATVETLYLSPTGGGLGRRGSSIDSQDMNMKRSQSVSQQLGKPSSDLLGLTFVQSPAPSNASTPTSSHPYAPLQSPSQLALNSPTLSASSKYAGKYENVNYLSFCKSNFLISSYESLWDCLDIESFFLQKNCEKTTTI